MFTCTKQAKEHGKLLFQLKIFNKIMKKFSKKQCKLKLEEKQMVVISISYVQLLLLSSKHIKVEVLHPLPF